MQPPVILQPIPEQVVNEKANFGPFDLKQYIAAEDGTPTQYVAGLSSGEGLPPGFICTPDGVMSGLAPQGTIGTYDITITAINEAGNIDTNFTLTIKENLAQTQINLKEIDALKAEAWKALGGDLPLPDLDAIYERGVTPLEVYYLLERWGTLTIYNAYNLDPPGKKTLLELPGVSPHFEVFDRGCCLVSSPKDLFSEHRTLKDGLMTARAMAREAYKREWAVELIGFEKYSRAAWIELQLQVDKHNREVEIINYNPSSYEIGLYTREAMNTPDDERPEPE